MNQIKEIKLSVTAKHESESKHVSQFEFVALMASLMALISLAMDALLPALSNIGKSIGITNTNESQLLITMMFLGLGIGQLISGPLSDSLGRKPITYAGFLIFAIASIISVKATSLNVMILGRILQGIGLSAPKAIAMAIVRDSYSGDLMARIMSFIMVIFVLVPAIAPSYGKLMLDVFNWESIFYSQLIIAVIIVFWFALRQRETLKDENKVMLKGRLFRDGAKIFFKSKQATIYTVILGVFTGSFLVFLSTAQTILGEQYNKHDQFPLLFAAVALVSGISTFINGILVIKLGMRKLIMISAIMFTLSSAVYVILFHGHTNPHLYILLIFLSLTFLSIGFMFGNLTTLAMQPLGKIAGMGAAINGFVSTLIAVPIASYIGSFLKDTAFPLFVGFFITGLISVLLLIYANRSIKHVVE
ncbi:Bcr/CflA family efflux MFS transporter [Puteibacter caeruleilacunae]|nr:Bcr/CflA family efflux MFS transporter [Puteibacter caeruleilacunae]